MGIQRLLSFRCGALLRAYRDPTIERIQLMSDPNSPQDPAAPQPPVPPAVPQPPASDAPQPPAPSTSEPSAPETTSAPAQPVAPPPPSYAPQQPAAPQQPVAPPPPAYGAPQQPQAPQYGAPAAPQYGAPAVPQYGASAQKSPVLGIISLIAGIVAVVFFWISVIPIVGSIIMLLISAAAVVLGFLSKSREVRGKGLWLTGIILGFVGALLAIIFLIIWIAAFAAAGNSY